MKSRPRRAVPLTGFFVSALLFVSTGQSALSGTPQLQKLMARYLISIELADNDVENVIRHNTALPHR